MGRRWWEPVDIQRQVKGVREVGKKDGQQLTGRAAALPTRTKGPCEVSGQELEAVGFGGVQSGQSWGGGPGSSKATVLGGQRESQVQELRFPGVTARDGSNGGPRLSVGGGQWRQDTGGKQGTAGGGGRTSGEGASGVKASDK